MFLLRFPHFIAILRPSVPVFVARQHFCRHIIAIFVFREVRTFSYCFHTSRLGRCFLRFVSLPSVYRVISSFVFFIALVFVMLFIALVFVMRFIALVTAVCFIALFFVMRFIALVIVMRFIAL